MNAIEYFIKDEKAKKVVPAYSKGLQKAIDPRWAIIWKEPVHSLNDEEKLIREAVKGERELFIDSFVDSYPSTGTAQDPRANARSNWKRIVDASLPEKPKGAKTTEARDLEVRIHEEVAKLIKAYYREEATTEEVDAANGHLELAFVAVGGDIAKLKSED